VAYLLWSGIEAGRMAVGWRKPLAFQYFAEAWRRHIRPGAVK